MRSSRPDGLISLLGFFVILVLTLSMLIMAPVAVADAREAYETSIAALLCDCGCHPQSVEDCACGRAAELREEMAGMADQGLSGDEIIAHYVAQSGEAIRVVPTANNFNLVAWLGPLVGLVGATLAMLLLIRRWQRTAPPEVPRSEAQVASDDPYIVRVKQQLEEME